MQNTGLFMGSVGLALMVGAGGIAFAEDAGAPPESETETARLEMQVRFLSAALSAARSENDALRARVEGKMLASSAAAAGESSSLLMGGAACVRESSRELMMVVMDAGARQGVRTGMVLMVMRDKQSLARVRVMDVRRRVAGAVIEELLPGAPFPESGDRLVVVTDGE